MGTASRLNVPGGREYPVAWFDSSGNAWLFGGYGNDSKGNAGCLNDLWMYDPSTREWTWVSGSKTVNQWGSYGVRGEAASSNVPGARSGSLSWLGAGGVLYVFGGKGYDSAGNEWYLNDLWKFDPAIRQWTWVSGSDTVYQAGIYGTKGEAAPANIPGGRYGARSWRDEDGRLWLFGGWGLDSAGAVADLNDLWRFDPATVEWTWVSGSDLINQQGVYGTKGVSAPDNIPGARDTLSSWFDVSGMLWLFGGNGYDSSGNLGKLNDLWRFDPTTVQWTWISGSNIVNQSGIYGTKGTASSSNIPGGRNGARAWYSSTGRFWLFAGRGYDSSSAEGSLDDLWEFEPATLEWTWVSGNSEVNHPGDYGTIDTRTLANVPGGREYSGSWLNARGTLWLFGGKGYDSHGVYGYLNDLWEYVLQ